MTKLAEGESGYGLHGSSLIAWRRTQCTTHSYYDDDDGDPNQPGEIKRCNWCIDNVAAYENSFPKRLRTPTIWPLSVGTRANNIFHDFQCVQNVESSKFNLFRECFIPAANTVDWQTLKLDNHGKNPGNHVIQHFAKLFRFLQNTKTKSFFYRHLKQYVVFTIYIFNLLHWYMKTISIVNFNILYYFQAHDNNTCDFHLLWFNLRLWSQFYSRSSVAKDPVYSQ